MRSIHTLLICAVSACGAAAAPVAPAAVQNAPPVEESAAPDLAGVSGATMDAVVDRVPEIHRRALAFQLIRDGNLRCTRRTEEMCMSQVADPEDGATLADPCLRRALVLALVGHDEGAIPDDVLRALPAAGDDVILAFAGVISPAQRIALAALLEARGQDASTIVGSVTPEAAADALRRLHLAAAVEHVDAERDPDLLVAVIADATFSVRARLDAIFALRWAVPDPMAGRSPEGDRLAAAVAPLVGDRDCRLAARAAEMRWVLVGDARYLPVRPRTHDRPAMMRAICVLAHYGGYNRDELLATYLPPGGVAVVYPEGVERAASPAPVRTRFTAGDHELGRILDLLAGAPCTATTCDVEIARIELGFSPDRKGDLQLGTITYHRDAAAEDRIDACTPEPGD